MTDPRTSIHSGDTDEYPVVSKPTPQPQSPDMDMVSIPRSLAVAAGSMLNYLFSQFMPATSTEALRRPEIARKKDEILAGLKRAYEAKS